MPYLHVHVHVLYTTIVLRSCDVEPLNYSQGYVVPMFQILSEAALLQSYFPPKKLDVLLFEALAEEDDDEDPFMFLQASCAASDVAKQG